MSKLFEFPKNAIVPKARVEKAEEQVLSVVFDLGLEKGEMPLAMVFENHNGEIYIRKILKDDKALELHRLLTE